MRERLSASRMLSEAERNSFSPISSAERLFTADRMRGTRFTLHKKRGGQGEDNANISYASANVEEPIYRFFNCRGLLGEDHDA